MFRLSDVLKSKHEENESYLSEIEVSVLLCYLSMICYSSTNEKLLQDCKFGFLSDNWAGI